MIGIQVLGGPKKKSSVPERSFAGEWEFRLHGGAAGLHGEGGNLGIRGWELGGAREKLRWVIGGGLIRENKGIAPGLVREP